MAVPRVLGVPAEFGGSFQADLENAWGWQVVHGPAVSWLAELRVQWAGQSLLLAMGLRLTERLTAGAAAANPAQSAGLLRLVAACVSGSDDPLPAETVAAVNPAVCYHLCRLAAARRAGGRGLLESQAAGLGGKKSFEEAAVFGLIQQCQVVLGGAVTELERGCLDANASEEAQIAHLRGLRLLVDMGCLQAADARGAAIRAAVGRLAVVVTKTSQGRLAREAGEINALLGGGGGGS